MLNLVLFGPPGAGKGTQAKFLAEKYNLLHISTGDLLRSEIAAQTALGLRAKRKIDKGELASDEVVVGMIKSKIENNQHCSGFIFDGFPRTVNQAIILDQMLNEKQIPVSAMLFLYVEQEELIKRLLKRGEISGRADDQNREVVVHRIEVYKEMTLPIIDYYKPQGKFFKIDGVGEVNEITERLSRVVEMLKKPKES